MAVQKKTAKKSLEGARLILLPPELTAGKANHPNVESSSITMMVISPELWDKAMERVRDSIGFKAYDAWLSKAGLEDFDPDNARLEMVVPNEFYRRWISKRYHGEIEEAFSETMGASVSVELIVDQDEQESRATSVAPRRVSADAPDTTGNQVMSNRHDLLGQDRQGSPFSNQNHQGNGHSTMQLAPGIQPALEVEEVNPPPKMNPRYIFDDYVVGESNRFAYSSSIAVSDPKSKAFNPLFIYGGSGLGKTHLMQAIGHKMYQTDPRLRILYVTSEHFINTFIESIQNKRHMEFRAAYRNVDLLLVDDVQFLMGKERTQQEFFHTFNALYDAGKKVVVSSDRSTRDLSTLEDRLRSRFEWGLMVDIQPPDLETRMAILRNKAKLENMPITNDVALFIAEHVKQNVRELEGALKRLKMATTLSDRRIDLEMAREVLGNLMIGTPQPKIGIEEIQRTVCSYFNITLDEMLGKNRSKKFSQPRHIAQYLCRKLTDFSFPDIAARFGGKDHTSVIYACRKVDQGLKESDELVNMVEHLSKQISKGRNT